MSNGNAVFSVADATRIAIAVEWVEEQRQGGGGVEPTTGGSPSSSNPPLRPALIVDAGPEGEDDFTDHRYWVNFGKASNVSGESLEAVTFVGDPVDLRPLRIVMATNLAEADAGSHGLPVGAVVHVTHTYDQSDPRVLKFYFSSGGGGKALKWVVIVAAAGEVRNVLVREVTITPTGSNEDLTATFELSDEAEYMLVEPGLRGKHYAHFVTTAENWHDGMFRMPVVRDQDGVWCVLHKPAVQMITFPGSVFEVTDCTPVPIAGG